ncbi:MAG TPA: alpha/beta hydrolase [Clostridiaceae bacterium]|nr:alpha/beta hydrolase [Clostridiaceae bacterium]
MEFSWIWIVLILVLVFILWFVAFLSKYANRVIYPTTKSYERAREIELEDGVLDESYLDGLEFETLKLKSPYGYQLYGRLYPNDSDRYIIIVHGITMNIYGGLKYLPIFHKRGFNVIVYDQRNHGESGGTNTTYGHFEKWDLKVITDYLHGRFGEEISVGLHGESMGSSVAILNMAIDPRIDFAISDCGFSDLSELMLRQLILNTKINSKKLLALINLVVRRKAGFSIEDVSPVRELPSIIRPILFIHGEADDYIPVKMTRSMFSFKLDRKFLYLVPNAGHRRSYSADKREYEKVICEFLNQVYYEKGLCD